MWKYIAGWLYDIFGGPVPSSLRRLFIIAGVFLAVVVVLMVVAELR